MRNEQARRLAAMAVALACWAAPVGAARIEGVHFDEAIDVGGNRLVLNGTGLREVYIVKTWVVGLYLPQASRNAADVMAPGPRRIAVTLLADISMERFARSLLDTIRRNHAPGTLAAMEPSIRQFVETLQSVGTPAKDDDLVLDFGSQATAVSFNGQPVGAPVPGAPLRNAILQAFVGNDPVDPGMRDSLLGQPAVAEVDLQTGERPVPEPGRAPGDPDGAED